MNGISQMGGYGGQQLAPQGIFGSLLGGPVGGLIGRGIGGLFGNASLGNQIGQLAGGIGGSILPFSADPMQQAYAQQLAQQQQLQQLQQLSPQGWLGNLIGQVGQPLGGAIGGIFGQPNIGSQIGGIAGQLGRLLPFSADPMQQAYGQQQQLAPQGLFGNLIGQLGQPLGGAIGSIFGQPNIGSQLGGIAGQLGRMLPFSADPIQQAYAQQMQQQMSPQGWIGNLIGQVGQPLGGAIGGLFGQSGLGNQIGGIASQLGRMLPFSADPTQQMQQMQQGYSPQGWIGNLIGQVGQPLGGAIGGLFGQSGLGNQIGGIASQLGRMLPFQMDPMQQMLAQQQVAQQLQQIQQLAQQQQQQQPYAQQGQQNYSGGQTLH